MDAHMLRRLVMVAACLVVALAVLGGARVNASDRLGYPAPDSCHVRGHGLFVLPDPRCTPSATAEPPGLEQQTMARTICARGWSRLIRPPESFTEPRKRISIASYGYYNGRALSHYEFDHLIPLSLGGNPISPRNLWPERDYPGVSSNSFYLNPKDKLEDKLHTLVCERRMRLRTAQRIFATNWVAGYKQWVVGGQSAPAPKAPPPAAWCTVRASYNSTYNDDDVYVHSNQPDKSVTVTDSHGDSKSWYTNSNGYADLYLHVHGSPAGQRVTAHVGGAICSGAL